MIDQDIQAQIKNNLKGGTMKLTVTNKNFEPCPIGVHIFSVREYTKPQLVKTDYGEQNRFKIICETLKPIEGTHYEIHCNFNATLNKGSNLRKFIEAILEEELDEDEEYDLDNILELPFEARVQHRVSSNDKTFANFSEITSSYPRLKTRDKKRK